MNPAFSMANIRALPPLFRNVSDRVRASRLLYISRAHNAFQMVEKWESKRTTIEPDQPMDVFDSLHDATLDAIGEGKAVHTFIEVSA